MKELSALEQLEKEAHGGESDGKPKVLDNDANFETTGLL